MAVPTFVAASNGTFTSASSTVTPTLPAGIADGDFLVFAVVMDTTRTVNTRNGWRWLFGEHDFLQSSAGGLIVLGRRYTAADPLSLAIVLSGLTNGVWGMAAFRGVTTSSPVDGYDESTGTATATSHSLPQVNLQRPADDLLVGIFGADLASATKTYTVPPEMTSRLSASNGTSFEFVEILSESMAALAVDANSPARALTNPTAIGVGRTSIVLSGQASTTIAVSDPAPDVASVPSLTATANDVVVEPAAGGGSGEAPRPTTGQLWPRGA